MVQKNQAVCGFLEQGALSGLSRETCVPCYIAYQFQEGLQQDHNSAGNSEITKKKKTFHIANWNVKLGQDLVQIWEDWVKQEQRQQIVSLSSFLLHPACVHTLACLLKNTWHQLGSRDRWIPESLSSQQHPAVSNKPPGNCFLPMLNSVQGNCSIMGWE